MLLQKVQALEVWVLQKMQRMCVPQEMRAFGVPLLERAL